MRYAISNYGTIRPVTAVLVAVIIFLFSRHSAALTSYCTSTNMLPHDFETGFDGWTSGGTGNEWETGTPGGSSCSGASSDPSAAYSNTGVLGLDLTGNGCYSNNADTYVTSPVFDCSGAVDSVYLKYFRWLGVESEPSDKASIEVNINGSGWTEIWSNSSLDVTDSAWSLHSISLPSAIGQSSVQIRFRLTSDNGHSYSGWNIDYFELVSTNNAPAAPTGLQAVDTPSDFGNSIDLSWTASSDDGGSANDVTGYNVWRKQGVTGTYIQVNSSTLTAGSTYYTDNSSNSLYVASNDVDYYYIIEVKDSSGQFTFSKEVGPVQALDNTNLPDNPVLSSPANETHTTDDTPTLEWLAPTDPDGDDLHFKIEISPDPSYHNGSYTEDFSSDLKNDPNATTAEWNTEEGKVTLTGTASRGMMDQGSSLQDHFYVNTGETNRAQTFEPSLTQSLYSVEVYMKKDSGGSGAVTLEVQGENGNDEPDGSVLATSSATVTNTQNWYEFVFNNPPILQAGQIYSFVLNQPSPEWFNVAGCCTVGGFAGNPYPDGIVTISTNDGLTFDIHAAHDMRFRTYAAILNYPTTMQVVQSGTVATPSTDVTTVTLYANDNDNGHTINYYVSADGGTTWDSVTPQISHNLSSPGQDIRWKAELQTSDTTVTPEILEVEIAYEDTSAILKAESKESTAGFAGTLPVAEGSGSVSYTVQSGDTLEDGQYYWRVAAWDGTKYGPWSTELWTFTVDTSPPVFAGLSNATNGLTGGTIYLEWNAASDLSPPVTYNIYRSYSSGFTPGTGNRIATGVSSLYYENIGLVSNTTYYYIVRAMDNLGHEDANSVEKSVMTIAYVPNGTCTNATYPVPHDFDSSDDGWTAITSVAGSAWERGAPLGGSAEEGNNDPSSPVSGSSVWGNNLAGQYENSSSEYLVSPAFDCTGLTNVSIKFSRWLNVEDNKDDATIEVSADSFSSVTTVYSTKSGPYIGDPLESNWHLITIDISSVADGQSAVQVRFGLKTNTNTRHSGWNIDDFNMVGVDSTPPSFAGIQDAQDAGAGGAVDLSWNAGSDVNSNPITYYIYMAESSDGQDFGNGPNFSTTDTSFQITGLTDLVEYFFVVRAVDSSGNIETNTVELSAIPTSPDSVLPIVSIVLPQDIDSGTHVDGSFNLSSSVSDNESGLQEGTCEYYCSGGGAGCDGTWQTASDNWSGTSASGACSVSSLLCNDGDVLTLNIRVKDNAGNQGVGSPVTRTCDTTAPSITVIEPVSDILSNTTSISSGVLTCSDTGAGLDSTPYDVQLCSDGADKGQCDGSATWSDTSATGFSLTNSETFAGTDGNWYRFRGRCADAVGNVSEYVYSTGYILVDTSASGNPTVSAYESSSKSVSLTSGSYYGYDAPAGPYFEWTAPADNPASVNSGVKGYYVYFGTNPGAEPSDFQTVTTFTNVTSLSAGTYYLRIKVEDNAGNVSSAATVFQYQFDSAAPTVSLVTPDSDSYQNTTTVTGGIVTCTDSESGLESSPYDVQLCSDGADKGQCDESATWSDTSATGFSLTNGEIFTGTDGNWYRFRGRCSDAVGNVSEYVYSTGYILVDTSASGNPTVSAYESSSKSVSLTSGSYYGYDAPAGPYFEWTAPSDNPASANSGVKGYYVYFGTNPGAEPSDFQTVTTFTNVTSLSAGTYYLKIKVEDNAGNVSSAATFFQYQFDTAAPTVSLVTPDTDSYQNTTTVTGGIVTCTDSESGLESSPYDVQWCSDGAAKGQCDGSATWSDTSATGFSVTNGETFTGADGTWYRFRSRCRDLAGNISAWVYSTGYVLVDISVPDALSSVSAYDSGSKTDSLTSGETYGYQGPSGPYFEWTTPADNPISANSGVEGYHVYFGTDENANPTNFQVSNAFLNSASLSAGNTYYLRIKTRDIAGNISSAATLFTYRYSGGAYLKASEVDNDTDLYGGVLGSTDNEEGVLSPDDSDYEIFIIEMYDEWDNLASSPSLNSAAIDIQLSNVGVTGVYIADTNLAGASSGPGITNITGTLDGGTGWIKVKASGSVQTDSVEVIPSCVDLSLTSGRNQSAFLLVRESTKVSVSVGVVHQDEFSPVSGGVVINPVWSHNGDEIVIASRKAGTYAGWNLYKLKWNGSGWDSPVRLTNDTLCVQPHSRFSFTGDDSKVVFSARPDCTRRSPVEMFAVSADGSDADLSSTDLETAGLKISDAGGYRWNDVDWSDAACAVNADRMLLSLVSTTNFGDQELFMFYGSKNSSGLYTESGAGMTPLQVTDISGRSSWSMQGAWSADCRSIVFTVWEGYSTSPSTGIYMIKLDEASLPVTSLNDTGVYAVHECDSTSCPNGAALYPSFSADGSMVTYMADPTSSFDMYNLIIYGATPEGNLAAHFFGGSGVNFNNYVEYILDQPVFSPQLLGQSANNEYGLVQCKGPACPLSSNGNIFSYVTQRPGTRDGKLSFLELKNESDITSKGGLLFFNGSVTAVIPPGALVSGEVKLQVEAPAAAPSTTDGEDLIISIGEAREFFPDGIVFDSDIRLVFNYCDSDNDGYLDINQDSTCSAGGNSSVDENKLYVYYWCEVGSSVGCSPGSWVKLDGHIDPVKNIVTVSTNHFSEYDLKALARGRIAPQSFVDLNLFGIHTYPNPWVSGNGNITFTADSGSTYNTGGTISVDIIVYDLRGSVVRRILSVHNGTIPIDFGGLSLAKWDVRNNAGRQVASGIYMYVMKVNDSYFQRTYTGKFSVVR